MPEYGHDAEVVILGVAAQLLDGDNQRVLEQVVIHHAVRHRDVVVVPAGGEQRIPEIEVSIFSEVDSVHCENIGIC